MLHYTHVRPASCWERRAGVGMPHAGSNLTIAIRLGPFRGQASACLRQV